MKVYRGAASAARAYVEADRSRVDDYYLAEGTGLARRFGASPDDGVVDLGVLDGDGYEAWVAGRDPDTGIARGRLRSDGNAVRFVEVTVNGPKTWSLAAALHPDVAAAYDAAQDRAAEQVIGWVAQRATTRVGPRGRQVQVPVERIEAVTVRHYTSRAGDPHRHLHLQINARVFADGTWRGLHTVGLRDSIEALNGIGHAAMMTDPEFRTALASAGFTVDAASREIVELAPYVGAMSDRSAQIGRNIDRYEAQWRTANPGEEPGPRVRRSWDRRAWKDARPEKGIPTDGAAMVAHWNQQLRDLGYRDPAPQSALPLLVGAPQAGALDRDEAVETVLSRLAARRSAWNSADIRGHVEKWIAATGVVVDAPVRSELAEDLTDRVVGACMPLVDGPGVPEHIRSLTSRQVLDVEVDIVTRLASRAEVVVQAVPVGAPELDEAQREAVGVLVGEAPLVVVEGAAGAGKTTTLAAVREHLDARGRRLLVATPTLKAAQVAGCEIGAAASVAWLIHQYGFRWDDDGHWSREPVRSGDVDPAARLSRGDLLLVDEAGMLDHDTARALLTVADETGARVALMGDRHQLPAVGRGGVLDLAVRWAAPGAVVNLDVAHRFADPEYAAISLALRAGSPTYEVPAEGEAIGRPVSLTSGNGERDFAKTEEVGERSSERVGEVWAALWRRDQVKIYASEAERTHALAQLAVTAAHAEAQSTGEELMIADTREQTAALNGAIRDGLVAAGRVEDRRVLMTAAGQRLGVGDRVATRLNDRDLGVANRDTWTITGVADNGDLTLCGRPGGRVVSRVVPASYARRQVELAYATTVYGAQGETTGIGHLVLGEHTSAASAYVGLTRGRFDNVVHIVAADPEDARRQWDDVFARDRADLGPAHAAQQAIDDIDRYGTQKPARTLESFLPELRKAWSEQADLAGRHQRLTQDRNRLQRAAKIWDRYAPGRERLAAADRTAEQRWLAAREAVQALDDAMGAQRGELRSQIWESWQRELPAARSAARIAQDGAGIFGQRRHEVREATTDLAAFGARWHPILPDLPADPAGVAEEVTAVVSWMNTRRIADHVNAYVERAVAQAHPEVSALRAAEQAARADRDTTRDARTALDAAYYDEIKTAGLTGYATHVHARLDNTTADLSTVETNSQAAGRRVARLQTEPAIAALGDAGLGALRDQWKQDRATAKADAARERLERAQAEQQRRTQSWTPATPDPGRGIGR